jgi:Thiamine monophosphate synthase
MLVTDDGLIGGRDVVALARAAEAGGATAVQLRLKRAPLREQVGLTRALVEALTVPVLVNDRPDVAMAAGAAGVHLGPDDLPVGLTRVIAPPGFVVGASVGSMEEAAAAHAADYWGIGPWRVTTTKADAGEGLGPGRLRAPGAPLGRTAVPRDRRGAAGRSAPGSRGRRLRGGGGLRDPGRAGRSRGRGGLRPGVVSRRHFPRRSFAMLRRCSP